MTNEEMIAEYQKGNKDIIEKLYFENYGFIEAISRRYAGYMETEDMMQEAFITLVESAGHYKADKENLFLSYYGKALKRTFYRLINRKQEIPEHRMNRILLFKSFPAGTDPQEIVQKCKWTESEYRQTLKDIKAQQTISLETEITEDLTLADTIESTESGFSDAERKLCNVILWAEVDKLPKEQAQMIRQKFINGISFADIANELKLTPEQLRTRFKKALEQLKKNKTIREIARDEFIYSFSIKRTTAKYFKQKGYSAVEKTVIELLEHGQKDTI